MTVRFHLFDAFDEIPGDARISILAALETALPKVLARLVIDRVDIVVGYSDPLWTIPAWGIGGYAHGKGRISITAAPNHPRFADPSAANGWRPCLPMSCTTLRAHEDPATARL